MRRSHYLAIIFSWKLKQTRWLFWNSKKILQLDKKILQLEKKIL